MAPHTKSRQTLFGLSTVGLWRVHTIHNSRSGWRPTISVRRGGGPFIGWISSIPSRGGWGGGGGVFCPPSTGYLLPRVTWPRSAAPRYVHCSALPPHVYFSQRGVSVLKSTGLPGFRLRVPGRFLPWFLPRTCAV